MEVKEEEGMATAARVGEDPLQVTSASDVTEQDIGKYSSDLSISIGCSTQKAAVELDPSGCST